MNSENPASGNSPAYERALKAMRENEKITQTKKSSAENKNTNEIRNTNNKFKSSSKGGNGLWIILSIIFFIAAVFTLCNVYVGSDAYKHINSDYLTRYSILSTMSILAGVGFVIAYYLSKITNNLEYLEVMDGGAYEGYTGNNPVYDRALSTVNEKSRMQQNDNSTSGNNPAYDRVLNAMKENDSLKDKD
jgi:hypothetical protein